MLHTLSKSSLSWIHFTTKHLISSKIIFLKVCCGSNLHICSSMQRSVQLHLLYRVFSVREISQPQVLISSDFIFAGTRPKHSTSEEAVLLKATESTCPARSLRTQTVFTTARYQQSNLNSTGVTQNPQSQQRPLDNCKRIMVKY